MGGKNGTQDEAILPVSLLAYRFSRFKSQMLQI